MARIPASTFDVIGVQPGASVAVSSTRARTRVRAAVLSDGAYQERRKLMEENPEWYEKAHEIMELHRMREGSGQSDLPPIFIDKDVRDELKITPGQPVRIVRDSLDVFYSRIYYAATPIFFGLVVGVLSFNALGLWWRLLAFLLLVVLTFGLVLLEVRSKFHRR